MHINCDLLHGKVHMEGMKMLYRCIGKIEVNFIFLSLVVDLPSANRFCARKKTEKQAFRHFSLACATIWDKRKITLHCQLREMRSPSQAWIVGGAPYGNRS